MGLLKKPPARLEPVRQRHLGDNFDVLLAKLGNELVENVDTGLPRALSGVVWEPVFPVPVSAFDARLRDRIDYLESELLESERDGDAAAIGRLQLELKLANESRRSIDRRREDTRLLARPTAVRA